MSRPQQPQTTGREKQEVASKQAPSLAASSLGTHCQDHIDIMRHLLDKLPRNLSWQRSATAPGVCSTWCYGCYVQGLLLRLPLLRILFSNT